MIAHTRVSPRLPQTWLRLWSELRPSTRSALVAAASVALTIVVSVAAYYSEPVEPFLPPLAFALQTIVLSRFCWLLWLARRTIRELATEQRQLRQSEERFRALAWNASDDVVIDEEDGTIRYDGSETDLEWVHSRESLESQLAHQAFHDALTQLPNRMFFRKSLERALARSRRRNTTVAVIFLDLDNFKVVNDSLGHLAGDQLLIAVAERLQACVRPDDLAARLGGDEFTVLLEDIADVDEVTGVAERIMSHLQLPLNLGGSEVFVTGSIGIALSGPGEDQPESLLRNADLAMYQAKSNGKACFALFDDTMNARVNDRLTMETDLRRVIERHEFVVYYQPIVRLSTGEIVGFEALLRWEHPRRGLVMPADFIPLAEETGMIVPFGRWVLREAARQMCAWQAKHPEMSLMLSVNLSGRQLLHADLIDDVEQVLETTGLDPSCLKLEITESVMLHDVEATLQKLGKLKRLMIQLAIDDFGTGYSSLAYLRRFPISIIKIDQSFVERLGDDAEDTAIVESIISLARALNLSVTGEGIETSRQAAVLQVLGCDQGQGHYFGRALPSQAAGALLDSPVGGAQSVVRVGRLRDAESPHWRDQATA